VFRGDRRLVLAERCWRGAGATGTLGGGFISADW
jgi:hypothetical protein